jgi:hypothetical protein
MQYRVCKTSLNKASLYIAKDSEPEKLAALNKVLSTVDKKNLFLVSSKNGEKVLPENAFLAVVKTQNDLFDSVEVNGLARKVNIRAKYDNPEDHFIVNTNLGPLRILEILFQGELSIEETTIPVIGGIRCL